MLLIPGEAWVASKKNKDKLQEQLGLPGRPETPLIGMVSRLVEAKGFDLIAAAMEELGKMDLQLVIMGTGDEKYVSMLNVAAHRYPDKVSAHPYFDEAMSHRIFAGSDLYLQPSLSEPCGTSQLVAMRYGSVPDRPGDGRTKRHCHSLQRVYRCGDRLHFSRSHRSGSAVYSEAGHFVLSC